MNPAFAHIPGVAYPAPVKRIHRAKDRRFGDAGRNRVCLFSRVLGPSGAKGEVCEVLRGDRFKVHWDDGTAGIVAKALLRVSLRQL